MEKPGSLASEISAREAERVRRLVTESGNGKSKVAIMMKYPVENGSSVALVKEATVKFTAKGKNPAEGEIYRFLMGEIIQDCARRDTDIDFHRLVVDIMAIRPV